MQPTGAPSPRDASIARSPKHYPRRNSVARDPHHGPRKLRRSRRATLTSPHEPTSPRNSQSSSGSRRPPPRPRRSQATAIVVGTIIGSGIFLVPTRDDARHRLFRARLPRLDCRRPALALRRHDLRRTRRHASLRRRRICLPSRSLRRHARLPLYVDMVRCRQARFHRRRHHRPRAHAGILSRLPVPHHARPRHCHCSGRRSSPSPSPGS